MVIRRDDLALIDVDGYFEYFYRLCESMDEMNQVANKDESVDDEYQC